MTKAYLVLSVRDIRSLLKVATDKAHRDGRRGRNAGHYCIVLNNLEVLTHNTNGADLRADDGEAQISSPSVTEAVTALRREDER